MKANQFADHMNEANETSRLVADGEPLIVVRHGRDGDELPVLAVKVRRDHRAGLSYIILEVAEPSTP